MAKNLLKAGHSVTVFDVAPAALKSAADAGATVAAQPVDVAKASDVIITMLPSNPHVREVYCGAGGILEGMKPGSLMIDSSTIDPNVAREVAAEVGSAGGHLVDAPVSGGVGGAEAGTLTFMVGGTQEQFDMATPVLNDMGANIVHCGDIGTGQVRAVGEREGGVREEMKRVRKYTVGTLARGGCEL